MLSGRIFIVYHLLLYLEMGHCHSKALTYWTYYSGQKNESYLSSLKYAFCYFNPTEWYQLIPKLENDKFFPSSLSYSNPISMRSVKFYSKNDFCLFTIILWGYFGSDDPSDGQWTSLAWVVCCPISDHVMILFRILAHVFSNCSVCMN